MYATNTGLYRRALGEMMMFSGGEETRLMMRCVRKHIEKNNKVLWENYSVDIICAWLFILCFNWWPILICRGSRCSARERNASREKRLFILIDCAGVGEHRRGSSNAALVTHMLAPVIHAPMIKLADLCIHLFPHLSRENTFRRCAGLLLPRRNNYNCASEWQTIKKSVLSRFTFVAAF